VRDAIHREQFLVPRPGSTLQQCAAAVNCFSNTLRQLTTIARHHMLRPSTCSRPAKIFHWNHGINEFPTLRTPPSPTLVLGNCDRVRSLHSRIKRAALPRSPHTWAVSANIISQVRTCPSMKPYTSCAFSLGLSVSAEFAVLPIVPSSSYCKTNPVARSLTSNSLIGNDIFTINLRLSGGVLALGSLRPTVSIARALRIPC
jgi:hypothetical protein